MKKMMAGVTFCRKWRSRDEKKKKKKKGIANSEKNALRLMNPKSLTEIIILVRLEQKCACSAYRSHTAMKNISILSSLNSFFPALSHLGSLLFEKSPTDVMRAD